MWVCSTVPTNKSEFIFFATSFPMTNREHKPAGSRHKTVTWQCLCSSIYKQGFYTILFDIRFQECAVVKIMCHYNLPRMSEKLKITLTNYLRRWWHWSLVKILVLLEDSLHFAFQSDNLHIETNPYSCSQVHKVCVGHRRLLWAYRLISKARQSLVIQRELGRIEECGTQLACPRRLVLTQLWQFCLAKAAACSHVFTMLNNWSN